MAKRGTRRIRLETALNAVETPVFVVDADRRVVFVNQGCEQLTGWATAEVHGRVCSLGSSAEPDSVDALTEALCPPPEVFSGERQQAPRYFSHRESGQTSARLVHFLPLHDGEANAFVMGVVTDVPAAGQPTATSIIAEVHAELAALRHDLRERFGSASLLTSDSAAMRRVLEQVQVAAATPAVIHLTGQPGTGREHVARAIHYGSDGGSRSFVPLDCKQLPPTELRESLRRLVETDWAEVSPTAALHPGTVCLQHIEFLSRDLQQRLVEFVQSRRGDAFRNQVRLMTISSADLAQLRCDETVVDDFYYLVTAFQIELPALVERGNDLRMLAQHFLEQQNRSAQRQVSGFSEDVWTQFEQYTWPGNLDELERVVTEAHSACSGSVIGTDDLPFAFRTGMDAQSLGPTPAARIEPLDQLLTRVEREHIMHALELASGNKAKAAKLLGMTRPALYRRIESLGLETD